MDVQWKPARVAFTFFEIVLVSALLVALIAVFFPVFASSGFGGPRKGSASISNIKQLAIAMIIYGNDCDDRFVIVGQWNSKDPDAHSEYPNSHYMPWTGVVEQYMKNRDILTSPLAEHTQLFTGPGKNQCRTIRACALLYPNYGYNGSYLSPSILRKGGSARIEALAQSAVARPAKQVLLTEIWSRNRTQYGVTSSGANDAYINFATAEAPDAATNLVPGRPIGRVSWGGYSSWFNSLLKTRAEGQLTAGVAFRSNGRTPVAFTDGHCKALTPELLAVGTDWHAGLTSRARNLHDGNYLWDPR